MSASGLAVDPTAAESAVDRTAGGRLDAVAERGGDLLNPILIKEVRQSFKSTQFLGSFWALLGICWLIGSCGLLFAGDAVEFGAIGGAFFTLFYSVLAFAVLLLVPYGAYRSVLNERVEQTWEVLSVTALSPRQIVLGKVACAAMQMLIYYCAVAPFVAFCSLMQGFDPLTAAFFLLATAWGAVVASSFAVMLASVVRQKVWQGLLAGALGTALFGGVWVYVGTAFGGALVRPLPFSDPAFQWTLLAAAVASGSYVVLFVNAAAAGLTFEADNRSTAVRVTVTMQFWLLIAAAAGVYVARPDLLTGPALAVVAKFGGRSVAVLGGGFCRGTGQAQPPRAAGGAEPKCPGGSGRPVAAGRVAGRVAGLATLGGSRRVGGVGPGGAGAGPGGPRWPAGGGSERLGRPARGPAGPRPVDAGGVLRRLLRAVLCRALRRDDAAGVQTAAGFPADRGPVDRADRRPGRADPAGRRPDGEAGRAGRTVGTRRPRPRADAPATGRPRGDFLAAHRRRRTGSLRGRRKPAVRRGTDSRPAPPTGRHPGRPPGMTATDAPPPAPAGAGSVLEDPAVLAAAARYTLSGPPPRGGGAVGGRVGRTAGSGLEFREHRRYLPGDDVRHLDWAAFARTDVPTVRVFREEVAREVSVWLDGSASMGCDEAKRRLAKQIAATFWRSAAADGDRPTLHVLGGADAPTPRGRAGGGVGRRAV